MGRRLDIAAGTAVRFEPGQSREVNLVPEGTDSVPEDSPSERFNYCERLLNMRVDTFPEEDEKIDVNYINVGSWLRNRRPEEIVRRAVKGMLPKNRLGRQLFTKLKVYAGPDHPHAAQTPELLDLDKWPERNE